MSTARDWIADALQNLQVYAPGEPIAADDAQTCLGVLNMMLDSWSNESLSTFTILTQSGTIQPGKNQYTIGPGGDFDLPRPIRLLRGPGAAYLTDTNFNRTAVNVVDQATWNQIWNLQSTTSNLVDTLFYDPQDPLGIINVWPMPSIGNTILSWSSYLPLADLANLDADVTVPPGYELAIKRNLAVQAKPYFLTAQLDPDIRQQANDAKGNIKRSNNRWGVSQYDPELSRSQGRPYNIYSDGYR